MSTPPRSRCRRRIAAATHNGNTLGIECTMWLNRFLNTTNPNSKQLAKDNWIEAFRWGKAMGCPVRS